MTLEALHILLSDESKLQDKTQDTQSNSVYPLQMHGYVCMCTVKVLETCIPN